MNLNPKTPKIINSSVKDIIRKLGLTHKPIYLQFSPRKRSYNYNDCFNNCELEHKSTGAEVIYGWLIWQDKKKSFIEAEFHAVIKENGVIKDITPRRQGEKEVLFIADDMRKSGRKDNSTWYSWSNLKVVSGYITHQANQTEVNELGDGSSIIAPLTE